MKRQRFPPWIWGFGWAMLPAAVTATIIANQLVPTHAMGESHRGLPTASITTVRVDEALHVEQTLLDAGALTAGDEVHVQVLVHNIWQRELALQVELQNLPGWSALLDKPLLHPGESTLLHLTGLAGGPGELNGAAVITALGDYLSLTVAVTGQIDPKPQAPECGVADAAPVQEPSELAPACTGPESEAEAPPEAEPEAPPEAEPEAPLEAEPEAPPEAEPEAPPEAEPEAPPEAEQTVPEPSKQVEIELMPRASSPVIQVPGFNQG